MKLLLLVWLVAVVAVFATEDNSHDSEISAIEAKLMNVVARGFALNSKLDARNDPKRHQRAKSLIQRIAKIEKDNGCQHPNHMNCDRFDPQCVNRFFVCDGKKDCRNGRDEQYCDLPFHEGDSYKGEVVFDHCTKRTPKFIDLKIRKIKTEIQGYTKVKASLEIKYDHHDHEGTATLFAKGLYHFYSKTLHLNPPESDQLGFYCTFMWGKPEKCVGVIKREASQEVCAKFIFHKHENDDDDDDHDDDNDHHHQHSDDHHEHHGNHHDHHENHRDHHHH